MVGPGAKWVSVDVHVHTPASDDYGDRTGGYEELAKAVGASGLDSVFVTDHNTADGYPLLLKAAKALGITTSIYPGAELSIPVPVMALDAVTRDEKKVYDAFFHCLVLLPPSDDAPAQIKNLVTKGLTKTEIWSRPPTQRLVQQSLEELSLAVRSMGGLLVPAHLNQGKSPTDSRSFDDIYGDPQAIALLRDCFTSAVEIRSPSSVQFFDGVHLGKGDLVIPERVCLLGSDAHVPGKVGVKRNYLKVGRESFDDISAALHYRERVRFEKPPVPECRLERVVVQGSFLETKQIVLNEELTALIGAKGSGKTALLECIRFAVGLQPDSDQSAYLAHVLGASGRVWASATTPKYGTVLFFRAMGSPLPRVFAADGSELGFEPVREALDITIRGWGEVTALAQNPDAQRRLIDGFQPGLHIQAVTQSISAAAQAVPALFQHLLASLQNFATIRQRRDHLRDTADRLKRLRVTRAIDEQDAKEARDKERLRLARLLDVLRSARDANSIGLPPGFDEIVAEVQAARAPLPEPGTVLAQSNRPDSPATAKSEMVLPHQDGARTQVWDDTAGALDEFSARDMEVRETRTGAFQQVIERVERAEKKFNEDNAPLEIAYEKLLSNLPEHERDILARRNQIIQETAQLPEIEAEYNSVSGDVTAHLQRYVGQLQEQRTLVEERTKRRAAALQEVNGELTSKGIPTRVRLLPALTEPDGATFAATVDSLLVLTPETALARFFSGGYERANARPEFKALPEDKPVIEFELYAGEWRASDRLSAGQRSTAVLPLLLLLSRGPVILDQPEDNLDNRYIGTTVVPLILKEKARRQLVVTSHNATLVVMGDAELVIEMTDAGGVGRVQSWGFLAGPSSTMRTPILTVLDGGQDAFQRRFRKYYARGEALS